MSIEGDDNHQAKLEAKLKSKFPTTDGDVDLDAARSWVDRQTRLRGKVMSVVWMFAFLFFSSVLVLSVCQHELVKHFDNCMTICEPYVSQQEGAMLRSRFARIHSGKDYLAVIGDLREIAKTNDLQLPVCRVRGFD